MNYQEAVKNALAGDEQGFQFLYESTCQSKFYLALQYMKNEQEAQDVIQDSYIRAFQKLNQLDDPDHFSSWLGTIVANTAKNHLAKKNPLLFTDVETGEDIVFQIEDESTERSPEQSFSKQETKEIVHELIDSLSDEQRLCILMYHIEGISIKEMAGLMGCSENTIKSRLKYGRDNLHKKAEVLKKKGYKLYGLSPLPLLCQLFKQDMEQSTFKIGLMPTLLQKAAGSFVKKGLFHFTVTKVVGTFIAVSLVTSGAVYGYQQLNQPTKVVETVTKTKKKFKLVTKEMSDEDFPQMVSGELSKQELQYLLAQITDQFDENGIKSRKSLLTLIPFIARDNQYVHDYGNDKQNHRRVSLKDLNRFYLAFTDYQFSNKKVLNGTKVKGNSLIFTSTELYTTSAEILYSKVKQKEMEVYYHFKSENPERAYEHDKKATLRVLQNGRYRILKIEDVDKVPGQPEVVEQPQPEQEVEQSVVEQPVEEQVPIQPVQPTFPVGSFSYIAPVGGIRAFLTIDAQGMATETFAHALTPDVDQKQYQMILDTSVSLPTGIRAYIFQGPDTHTYYYSEATDSFYTDPDLSFQMYTRNI